MAHTETYRKELEARKRYKLIFSAVIGIVVVFIGIFSYFIWRFHEDQKQQSLDQWQQRLSIYADARASAVDRWLGERFSTLFEIAQNESVQLYLAQINEEASDEEAAAAARVAREFLSSLVDVKAQASTFFDRRNDRRVRANYRTISGSGIAIIDLRLNPVVTSSTMPPLSEEILKNLREKSRGEAFVTELHKDAAGALQFGFVVPIYGLQQEELASEQIAYAVGVREIDPVLTGDFYSLLINANTPYESLEALLINSGDGLVHYASPLANATPPLTLRMSLDDPSLAAAAAIASPGRFGSGKNYDGEAVLYTSRTLANAPWIILQQIGSEEALSQTRERLQGWTITFGSIAAATILLVFAVWFYGSTSRAFSATAKLEAIAESEAEARRFIEEVTDNQTNNIFVCDPGGAVTFLNRAFAWEIGASKEGALGKPLEDLLGPHRAADLKAANEVALSDGITKEIILSFGEGSSRQHLRSYHTPMKSRRDSRQQVLVVQEDLTDTIEAANQRELAYEQIIATLANIIDARDPHTAQHSERVALLARRMSEAMNLSEDLVEATQQAGSLMNLWKILVPPRILNKTEALTEEEEGAIHEAMQKMVKVLEGLTLKPGVQKALEQIDEHYDGSGHPRGLAGDAISPLARVLTAANAYVAMMSPRANRKAMEPENRLNALKSASGGKYDPAAVAALVHLYYNDKKLKNELESQADN